METAAAHARSRGRGKALRDIHNRAGPFDSGAGHVYALAYNGTARALPLQTEMVGTSFYYASDSTSQYCIRAEIEFARKGGEPHLPVVAATPVC